MWRRSLSLPPPPSVPARTPCGDARGMPGIQSATPPPDLDFVGQERQHGCDWSARRAGRGVAQASSTQKAEEEQTKDVLNLKKMLAEARCMVADLEEQLCGEQGMRHCMYCMSQPHRELARAPAHSSDTRAHMHTRTHVHIRTRTHMPPVMQVRTKRDTHDHMHPAGVYFNRQMSAKDLEIAGTFASFCVRACRRRRLVRAHASTTLPNFSLSLSLSRSLALSLSLSRSLSFLSLHRSSRPG